MVAPKPARPTPKSDRETGSGTAGELTPARKTVGGRLEVLPPSPQAKKLSVSVEAVAVSVTVTCSQA
jgi:hypothetical protein